LECISLITALVTRTSLSNVIATHLLTIPIYAFAVNAIFFHPVLGTLSTVGSDGTFHFWDKEAHQRLRAYHPVGGSITASTFKGDGKFFVYGVSYGWSKGHAYNTTQYPTKAMLHQVNGEECNPRALVKRR
jgi:mRNA export factor